MNTMENLAVSLLASIQHPAALLDARVRMRTCTILLTYLWVYSTNKNKTYYKADVSPDTDNAIQTERRKDSPQ